MKKLFMLLLLTASLSCSKDEDNGSQNPPPNNNGGGSADCGTYLGYQLYKDSEGCYYNGANYSKVYVDDNNCNCD